MRAEEIWSRGNAKRMRRALTKAETMLWSKLKAGRAHGYRFRRQHPIGPFIADFVSVRAKLVIELDGVSHWVEGAYQYDLRRETFLRERGWRVLRFANEDVFANLSGV